MVLSTNSKCKSFVCSQTDLPVFVLGGAGVEAANGTRAWRDGFASDADGFDLEVLETILSGPLAV